MNKEKLMKRNMEPGDFTGGVDGKQIDYIQDTLKLDTSNMENNECPVIAWNKQGGLDDYNTAENFYEFFSQRLMDAKEAWEEDF